MPAGSRSHDALDVFVAPAPPSLDVFVASAPPSLDVFVASAPPLQRAGMRTLIALARRPRGAGLLARIPIADQLAQVVLALGRYDDPDIGHSLGWDAAAVVARGRALRRAEGRP